MPNLLLLIGVLTGLWAFYRFFISAKPSEVRQMLLNLSFVMIALLLFYLTLTGRLPYAFILIPALLPILRRLTRLRAKDNAGPKTAGGAPAPLSRAEALEILGLDEGAQEEDIQNAYKKLMKKLHPDQEGSDWLASKLNQARDVLLG